MPAIKRGDLTLPDMVLLRLLAERPMHGHRASLELARHKLHRWTGVSRPQVYWSLNKLEKMGLIRAIETGDSAPPRHRRVFELTEESRRALDKSLGRKYWATQILRPTFPAWLVIAKDADPAVMRRQIQRRTKFLKKEIKNEENARRWLRGNDGARSNMFDWVIGLNIEQLGLEIRWLRKLSSRAAPLHRARNRIKSISGPVTNPN
jgi:DNA-binding PadR family transcriptional regulator